MIHRRRFLATVPAVGMIAARMVEASLGLMERLGVQLYTVRELMVHDADRTLAAIADIGYREVELAGLYGHSAREFRAKLDAVGLRAVSSHLGLEEVRTNWGRTLEGAAELGQSLIVVPSIPGDERSRAALERIADDFNRAGEAAAAVGLRFGYHNHDWEFRAQPDGSVPIDILLDRTDAEIVDWQMDVFWTVQGGANPTEQLRRRAGRVTSVHVKDRTASGDMVDVGDGVIDYPQLLASAERSGMHHAFVEHDRPVEALESVRRSFDYLAPRLGIEPAGPSQQAEARE